MKLTTQQIDQLYLFTRQHYVEYYDLQTELVDHLANAIESEWQQNPKLTFDEVLNEEFKKFGVFGFVDVVQKRQAALGKKYNRLIFQHFKTFFKVPKILFLIVMTFTVFLIFKTSIYSDYFLRAITVIYFGFICYKFYESKKIKKAQKNTNKKKWLLEEIINQNVASSPAFIGIFHILMQIILYAEKYFLNDYWIFSISFLIVLFGILNYILFKIIPSKAQTYLEQTYPEYKLENL
ncbi:hypothetical protein [Flavobacterium glaciei]|uniref:Uncharacterized protein n=1 Tax=Flavobacterium glaciei TaxID=386300 RepID=A0A562PXC5_9FLAO|nr:hypothetical protein [Flavobacterium glaciei]RDI56473.1 hypothetical protein DFR66_10435 [Flavobacterium glaciei]TWI49043.1 hypothetical protein IQ02_01028 [Flavobacterium glaciei]